MKIAFFLISLLFATETSNSQILKFNAKSVQVILNDKYGNYALTGEEISIGEKGLSISINLNNSIINIANDAIGNFSIKKMENYKDRFQSHWYNFNCVDKDGLSRTLRLQLPNNGVDATLYIDKVSETVVYKLRASD